MEPLQEKFNLEVARGLRTIALVLALLYLFYVPSHLLVMDAPNGVIMAGTALASSSLFAVFFRRWGVRDVRPERAHPYLVLLASVILVNCLLHLYLTAEIEQTTNVLLLIVALGSLVLSLPWLLASIASTALGWWLVVTVLPAATNTVHYSFALLAASLMALLIYTVRSRILGRLERQRRDLERTVASLQESEERFQRLADASFEGIVVHERGVILDANERLGAMVGFRPDELIGRHVSAFVSDANVPFILERTSSGENYSQPAQIVGRKRDGSLLPVELLERPLPYKERTVRVAAVRDLSVYKRTEAALRSSQAELREKNAELERANRLKSEFLATMSHELRTPLTAVLGFSQLLADELFGPLNDKQREQVRSIHDSGSHLLSLISDILDLSKIEADRVSLTRRRTHMEPLLREALNVVRAGAEAKGIALSLGLGPLSPLECDPMRVKQVLYNYLGNAVKFTPLGGRVDLRAHEVGGWLRVEVEDNGVGIADDDLGKLFQPFSQVDSSLSRNYGGTGLGLALSKRLVELHGGEVWVRSAPDEGSCFGFSLPSTTGEEELGAAYVEDAAPSVEDAREVASGEVASKNADKRAPPVEASESL